MISLILGIILFIMMFVFTRVEEWKIVYTRAFWLTYAAFIVSLIFVFI